MKWAGSSSLSFRANLALPLRHQGSRFGAGSLPDTVPIPCYDLSDGAGEPPPARNVLPTDDLNANESTDSEGAIERILTDFQTHTLAELKGGFAQLIYLASLRDYSTGRYHHYGLESRYDPALVDRALHQCHIQVFEDLIAIPLEDQTRGLLSFFESLREDRRRLVKTWQELRSFQVLPPEGCLPMARKLFDNNLEIMLRVLRETDLWELLHEPHGYSDDLP